MIYLLGILLIGAIGLAMFAYGDSRESRGIAAQAASEARQRQSEAAVQMKTANDTLGLKWETTKNNVKLLELRLDEMEKDE